MRREAERKEGKEEKNEQVMGKGKGEEKED